MHWFTGRLHEVLDEVTGVRRARPGCSATVPLMTLGTRETAEAIRDLAAAQARIDGLMLTLLAHADDVEVAKSEGATSTQAWLAHATTTTHRVARAQVKLASALDERHPEAAAALHAGRICREQADVICAAVDRLPVSVGLLDRNRAERHLLDEARTHNAKQLRVLGKHLLEVIDPEAADAELATQLEAEERLAARRTYLAMHDHEDGTWSGRFRIPELHAGMLRKALHALSSPRRKDPLPREAVTADGESRKRPRSEVFGEAFCDYIERFPSDRLTSGGVDATIVVTMTLESLLGGLKAAQLDTGGALSAAEARRLACQAGIIPAVLGGKSEVLDLGRRRRFHTRAQRLALALRDGGCTAEGCDRPAGFCHAHHDHPWSRGGSTTVDEGRLVCPRHHTLVHHPGFDVTPIAGNRLRITRRRRT